MAPGDHATRGHDRRKGLAAFFLMAGPQIFQFSMRFSWWSFGGVLVKFMVIS
jgi:hypothetical protein